MRLADWQSAFIYALKPQGCADSLIQLVNEREQDRLEVYRNNAFQAILSALQLVFPVCQTVVGETCFTQLVKGYARQCPLNDSNLNRYGQNFAHWLAVEVRQHQGFKELQYLPELAQLEWLLNQSYYAMDVEAMMQPPNSRLEQLAELNEEEQQQAMLLLRPDLALLICHYPVQEIWHRHNPSSQSNISEHIDSAAYYLVTHRIGFKAQCSLVKQPMMQLLQALTTGQTLAQITGSALDLSLLTELIERQWICGFRFVAEAG
ncbi:MULTISPECIES: DNA-binding domain-containing protein [unclassified Shewanella]|uniref:HvfC/BufC N-terminal domain-containing protein n=1 Tax=unclassified Shewanella TaxID=196818 RepID=UPI001BB8A0CA|nr:MULTISPECIES: DNA-binding domain-containing protein [unclassified Shewanella]GIU14998.1 hypothetical protein TUM4444_25560 [Shewanella sp. MBTL60-112-B1]GIU39076.1 hypothetical protein TUM4445_34530 [Shewanella sp. MBTL60-112-B2]